MNKEQGMTSHDGEFPHLKEATVDAWNRKAAFWAQRMGEAGNAFHQTLVEPTALRLLALQPGERVLEIACGHGIFARRLADLGADVLAIDASPVFVEEARRRTAGRRVQVKQCDATDEAALRALGRDFDAVVSNMALMDIPQIAPLFRAVAHLLRPGGRFVFTLCHPAFNQPMMSQLLEEIDEDGYLHLKRSLRIWGYLTPTATPGVGMVGEPVPHYYFHRPLHVLLGHAFAAGLVVDGLEEAAFPPPEDETTAGDYRPFGWQTLPDIPPVLGVRVRRGE
ncbi:hypothetical protein ARMA_0809 [Ardenticatena maritima]|uniref:Methyltransferase domain-containing protein n=2 Tax=Ardenticatena maritima TaxID=872965 RepID=A0A0M8K8E2_9CHLR|nr:hypothetical protein ARMA_0809 [Ardenticatena maritima]